MAAQCPSILPEVSGYHTGGVTWRKPISLPLQHTYLEVVGSNPETAKNFFCTKFNCSHEEMISMLMLTFLSYFFPIQLVWCCIDPSFLLFLLPLQSLRKLYVVPTKSLRNFPIFLFYPIPSRPRLGNSQLKRKPGTVAGAC